MFFKNIINLFWSFFCSLKLAVILLLLIVIGSLIGMFYDQTLTVDQHLSHYSHYIIAFIFMFFEIYDVFHSWWFILIILMLALNLIACSIQSLPRILSNIFVQEKYINDKLLNKISWKCFIKYHNQHILKNIMLKIFKKSDIIKNTSNNIYFFKEINKYASLGVYIIHTALLFIIFGSILTSMFGLDGIVHIKENDMISKINIKTVGNFYINHNLKFKVKCTNFKLTKYMNNSPLSYMSNLEIYDFIKSKNYIVAKAITVNNPLSYNGYNFYQTSYEVMPNKEKIILLINIYNKLQKKEYKTYVGDKIHMLNGITFIPVKIIHDFIGLGLALKIKKIYLNGFYNNFVIFKSYATFDSLVRKGYFNIILKDVVLSYKTGLQVTKTPFIGIVFFGFILLIYGFIITFTSINKKYYGSIMYLKKDNTYELCFALYGHKNQYNLEHEFNKLRKLLYDNKYNFI